MRSLSAILALTSLMLLISAAALLPAMWHHDTADRQAQANLTAALQAAEAIRRETGEFAGAQPATLAQRLFNISVVPSTTPSGAQNQVSMAVQFDGWYGAVRSGTGRCYAAATVQGNPTVLEAVLAGNCTGDAARAALMPVTPLPVAPPPAPTISAG